MILGVTGHRTIQEQKPGELVEFARLFLEVTGADHVITGMAIGWDQAVAQACLDLGIPYTAAVPFPGQADIWPLEVRRYWMHLVNAAAKVNIGAVEYSREALLDRNKWIVDRSQELGSFLEPGTQKGGTLHATLYAERRGRKVWPLWDRWKRFQSTRRTT